MICSQFWPYECMSHYRVTLPHGWKLEMCAVRVGLGAGRSVNRRQGGGLIGGK